MLSLVASIACSSFVIWLFGGYMTQDLFAGELITCLIIWLCDGKVVWRKK